MPEESVVLEPVEANKPTEDKGHDLDGFDHSIYTQYFPAKVNDKLTEMLVNHHYGWMNRARVLRKIADHDREIKSYQADLVDSFEQKSRDRNPMGDAKAALRRHLNTLTDAQLMKACELKNVSYNSYMNSNDKPGLIDAIIGEMLVEV